MIKLTFVGIDSWNRPVFKWVHESGRTYYIGSVNHLFDDDHDTEDIKQFFRQNSDDLEYFGTSFGCEPHGGLFWKPENIEI